jgi:hypothetical protein
MLRRELKTCSLELDFGLLLRDWVGRLSAGSDGTVRLGISRTPRRT